MWVKEIPQRWDDGIPLGNGSIGSLVWLKDGNLRLSIDKADLWDLRPVKEFEGPEFNHEWVYKQVMEGDYAPVQKLFDIPYVRDPGPSKIPGGALEFDTSGLGDVKEVRLQLEQALCRIEWASGIIMESFIHATEPVGWFRFTNVEDQDIAPLIIAPAYSIDEEDIKEKNTLYPWQDLRRLGYAKGVIRASVDEISYHQPCWENTGYDIVVKWTKNADKVEGTWSITSNILNSEDERTAAEIAGTAFERGFDRDYESHCRWWEDFWSKSSIEIPDTLMERQWYRDIYKYGATSRRGAPPVSLQAVWTADDGKLPPWKGDFHNDMNTQMSNWAGYSSNHLQESRAFTDWLVKIMPNCKKYTQSYFGVGGLNVPGVATVTGDPLGGWIQYAFSYTAAGWLAQHFYLQWQYGRDRDFLKDEAYPYFREVATYFEEITVKQENGMRKLPLSSSAEIHDNSIEAWFRDFTCIDLSLIRFTFGKAAELAAELGLSDEAKRWTDLLAEFPELPFGEKGDLLLAMNIPLEEAHRHHSHLMAIHPLGMISWEQGEKDRGTIIASLEHLEELGVSGFSGWPSVWYANLLARAGRGEDAARVLNYFCRAFVGRNSFHTNSDQLKGKGRIFTLEGNFGFASGVQEMLLQSQNGLIRIFPAIPAAWQDVTFDQLRAEGAFLVSVKMENGNLKQVRIVPEKGGMLRLLNPFVNRDPIIRGIAKNKISRANNIIEMQTDLENKIIFE